MPEPGLKTKEILRAARGKGGAAVVAGTIMGIMVGGNATIGTAQLAFLYGLDAWWFCIELGSVSWPWGPLCSSPFMRAK